MFAIPMRITAWQAPSARLANTCAEQPLLSAHKVADRSLVNHPGTKALPVGSLAIVDPTSPARLIARDWRTGIPTVPAIPLDIPVIST